MKELERLFNEVVLARRGLDSAEIIKNSTGAAAQMARNAWFEASARVELAIEALTRFARESSPNEGAKV